MMFLNAQSSQVAVVLAAAAAALFLIEQVKMNGPLKEAQSMEEQKE